MRDYENGYNAWRELSKLGEQLKTAINDRDEAYCGSLILDMLWTICHEHCHPRVMCAGDKEFLFNTESKANAMADVMELATGESYGLTGYYDPTEDEREHCVDMFTGKWYATWD